MKSEARERVELALQMADETGIHFYDAELLRSPGPHAATTRMTVMRNCVRPSNWRSSKAIPYLNCAPRQTISSLCGESGRARIVRTR